MIAKTLSGFPIIDDSFGGIFSNRSFLVCGPSSSGKTVFGLRFTQQGLQQNERCLYLSTIMANDLSICAESLGIELGPSIDSGDLTLLEYESFIHGNGAPGLDMLPPEGFDQLRDIIHANSIERVVLDTVLPWVSVKQPDRMAEQIFSFTRSFDRLGVTTMLTLPKPVSNMSFRLKKSIEDVVPISVLLGAESPGHPATVQVVKYLGEKKLGGKTAYDLGNGKEIDEEAFAAEMEKAESEKELSEELKEIPASSKSSFRSRPSFSPIQREAARMEKSQSSPPPSPQNLGDKKYEDYDGEVKRSPQRFSTRTPEKEETVTTGAPKGARLSSIWKPHPSNDEPRSSND
ncbi:RAD55 family ATPase [Kiritimatiellaeota bacterium B1221]|nr:RAD55 family ATPase [Kiritimatiellaeota bacterium B1221]